MTQITRQTEMAEQIVFVDGLTGTGKTMMGPLMGSFKRVELERIEHIYQYLCILDDFGKIDRNAAVSMMRMYADLAIYDSMISRETNFRYKDLSGVFSNPNTFQYFRRLFYPDGNAVMERINSERPILQIVSQQALGVMDLAFAAYGDRLRIIEMVRHPLYLLEHWHSYIDRFGTDPRDFTIWLDHDGQEVPWFALGWEDKYKQSNSLDKVIYSFEWLSRKSQETVANISEEQRKQVLNIPFEKFVLSPDPFIDAIGALLGTEPTAATRRVLRRQNCPRELVGAGPAKAIYKRYGWRKPERGTTELDEFNKKRQFAESHASREALKVLDAQCAEYENMHGLWF